MGKTLEIQSDLKKYIESIKPREHDLLKELREKTLELEQGIMMSPPDQVDFLCFLMKLLKPKRILEIGTFTGYFTLAMALATSEDCLITTCDLDQSWTDLGKSFWGKANVAHRIELKLGQALNFLKSEARRVYDFIFIDADKINYKHYLDLSLTIISDCGLIVVDNIFWGGRVFDEKFKDFQTESIRAFNQSVLNIKDIEYSILPIGDGLLFISKKRTIK